MRHLSESIFGDNIKSNVNISDIDTAVDLIVNSLESKLKLKCLTLNDVYKDSDIWKEGWHLYRIKNLIWDHETIYLQNSINIPESLSNETLSIRFQVFIEQNRKDLYVSILGFDVFENYNIIARYVYKRRRPLTIWTSIQNAHLSTNFEGVLSYLINAFWTFKQFASHGITFDEIKKKTIEHYFCKVKRKKERLEDEVEKELDKAAKDIIK